MSRVEMYETVRITASGVEVYEVQIQGRPPNLINNLNLGTILLDVNETW